MIVLITPTGDRPEAFKLCERWMNKQTVKWGKWIVVDDGVHESTKTNLGQTYIRRERKAGDPPHTLCLNLLQALPKISADDVALIIEDDDYYAPTYIARMLEGFKGAELIGQPNAVYYNIRHKHITHHPNLKHASLCQTGFKYILVRQIIDLIEKSKDPFIDLKIWALRCRKAMLPPPRMCVGLKGLPGRFGIGSGHNTTQSNDLDLEIFKSLLGGDAQVYIDQFNMIVEEHNLPIEIRNLRKDYAGNFISLRDKPKTIALLHKYCDLVSIEGSASRWTLKSKVHLINDTLSKYDGKVLTIVGKGPSLDHLKKEDLGDGPILTLNEAIHKVEQYFTVPNDDLWAMQQDQNLEGNCMSKYGNMLLVDHTLNFYKNHERVYKFSKDQFQHKLSLDIAVDIARFWGCSGVRILCCDSLVNKEKTGYAHCIGHKPVGNPIRFANVAKEHLAILDASGLKYEIIIPSERDDNVANVPLR